MKYIASDEPMPPQETAPGEHTHADRKKTRFEKFRYQMKDKSNRLIMSLLCATLVVLALVGFLFGQINSAHQQNVIAESGQHLSEISNQIKLYIEDNIDIDWKIAQSAGDSILGSAYVDDDPAVFDMLQKKQDVWGVSDLMLYTENGYCIYANGSTETTDVASKAVYYACKLGKYLSIVESRLIFTVPLDTTLTLL